MAAKFSFSEALFVKNASRYLPTEGKLRNLTVGGKIHGRQPQQFSNCILGILALNFVLRGSGKYTDEKGREYKLTPGTLFHRYPGVRHSTWFDPESNYAEFFIVFDKHTGTQLMELGVISDVPVDYVGVDPLVFEEFKQLRKRTAQPETKFPSRRAIVEAAAFINSLYDRARSFRTVDFWVQTVENACALLACNLGEAILAENIAEQLGVTYAALRKNFRRLTGYSMADYRIRRRLEAAQYSLPGSSIKQTAREFGYCDSFAFSRQFKRFIGISPRDYKRRSENAFVFKPLTGGKQ